MRAYLKSCFVDAHQQEVKCYVNVCGLNIPAAPGDYIVTYPGGFKTVVPKVLFDYLYDVTSVI